MNVIASQSEIFMPRFEMLSPAVPTTFYTFERKTRRGNIFVSGWESWLSAACVLLKAGISHEKIFWNQTSLPAAAVKAFPERMFEEGILERFETASCHRSHEKWPLFYKLFWKMYYAGLEMTEEKDEDVRLFLQMEKAVLEDMGKMKSEIRFRFEKKTGQHFAWYRPAHFILEKMAQFFIRNLGPVSWTLSTPDRSFYWNTSSLLESRGLPEDPFKGKNLSADLWPLYHAALFKKPFESSCTPRF